ncbi:MAG TPA: hypothetical protein VF645_01910 [Allosphingosinicella sp.]|jgi:hypothetical protein
MMKEPSQLLSEFTREVRGRVPAARARVGGQRYFLEARLPDELQRRHSSIWWIHLAHLGTLDKLEDILTVGGLPRSIELIAIARNLFENLVWLKLMQRDHDYGLVFYSRLLMAQAESIQIFIDKLTDEAALFDLCEGLDDDVLDSTLGQLILSDPGEAEIAAAQDEFRSQQQTLDDLVRREFSLFAAPATFNGYGRQADLLRTETIPAYETDLAGIAARRQALEAVLPSLIEDRLIPIAEDRRWNWAARAREAGLEKHYRFLYPYTSKLLHSTPLNIITDKALSPSEFIILLDYTILAGGDLLDCIDSFKYDGQVRAISVACLGGG